MRHNGGMRKRSEVKKDPLDGDDDTAVVAEQAAHDLVSANPGKPKKTYNFRSAQARTSKDKELRDDLADIVETVFIENMHASWQRIKASIQPIGTRRSEHGILAVSLIVGSWKTK